MNATLARRIIVPLDVPTAEEALQIVSSLKGRVGMFKVGLELFCAEGPAVIEKLAVSGARLFLDLKLHDIPNTVARAIGVAGRPGVAMVDVHIAGAEGMLRAAVEAVRRLPADRRPLVLGITVLTSLDQEDLVRLGVGRPVEEQAVELARLGQAAGLDGVVASPHEIAAVKQACGQRFVVVAPGIRPAGSAPGDQKRFMTPARALAAGADYLVIGRPILEAPDPAAAVDAISRDLTL